MIKFNSLNQPCRKNLCPMEDKYAQSLNSVTRFYFYMISNFHNGCNNSTKIVPYALYPDSAVVSFLPHLRFHFVCSFFIHKVI